MQPRLASQEALDAIQQHGLGVGAYKREDAGTMLDRLERLAHRGVKRAQKASLHMMSGLGLGVRVVEKRG